MATSSFFMGSMGGAGDDEPDYLLRPGRRSNHRLSLVTVGVTSGLAVTVTVLVCAVCVMKGGDAMLDMQKVYGVPRCPAPGRMGFSEPVVNYSPCCVHYPATCCSAPCDNQVQGNAAICRKAERFFDTGRRSENEHGGGAERDGDRGARPLSVDSEAPLGLGGAGGPGLESACPHLAGDACAEKRNLLACARCSPFAGHFELAAGRNLTVCPTFCKELWRACRDGANDVSGWHAFCTGLGVTVAHEDANCFII